MDSQSNPYSPPQTEELAKSLLLPGESFTTKRRRLAIILFAFSVGVAVLFTLLDDAMVQTRIGAWPIVFCSGILSLLSSVVTRDPLFAPLSCFGAIVVCSLTVAVTHSVQYAQFHISLPIAMAFSVPSLIIAAWLSRK